MAKSKKIILTAAMSSVLLHLVIFLMYFIPYYVMESDISSQGLEIYEYVRTFVSRFLEFSIPAVACAVVYFSDSSQKGGKAVLKCLYVVLGRLVYLLPYYYLWFMEISGGADSVEAIIMASLSSIFDLIFFWAYTVILYVLLRFVAKRIEYRKALNALTPQIREKLTKDDTNKLLISAKAKIDAYPEQSGVFDFSNALCAGLFATAFIQFLVCFVQEAITTVDYLKSYAGNYRAGEILYMIFSFLFIFASMLLTHMINYKLATALREKEVEAE